MKMLRGCLKGLQITIVLSAIVLVGFIAYFNVVEYRRVLIDLGVSAEPAIWLGTAAFLMIQAQEVRPILIKQLHNQTSEMIAFAEKAGSDAKPLVLQLKEEQSIRTRQIRRAMTMSYIFTVIDLILCTTLLFTPIIRPGVSPMTVLLTMGVALINWWNVTKTLLTVWALPWIIKMLISESSDAGLPNLAAALDRLKERMPSRPIQAKPEQAKQDQPRTAQAAPAYFDMPPATYRPLNQESNGKAAIK
jgi:hypothetical protein